MRRRLAAVGPAIIVASVVLGPGSILASSRIGCDFGFDLLWLVVVLVVLLIGMTALASRLGVQLDGTLGDEITERAGRPLAVVVGVVLFGVVACFQFSNNVAIVAALEPLVGTSETWSTPLLVAINLAALAVLFGSRRLYRPVEVAMKLLVAVMLVGFAGNVVLAEVPIDDLLRGLVPNLPDGIRADLVPHRQDGTLVDSLLPLQALIGTTFSVAGAYYQAYLVREKGFRRDRLGDGLIDSTVGIGVLGCLTALVMITAAATLHGHVAGAELRSAADVAVQLEPLFGGVAKTLFSLGLLAAAISSFLVNAMIGGTILADGLGFGGGIDARGPKLGTALALLIGMGVAIATLAGRSAVDLVLFAQALTVLGNPLLAGVLLWLSSRWPTPRWIRVLAALGLVLVLGMAVRTGWRLWLTWT